MLVRCVSLPSRGRGLKCTKGAVVDSQLKVAPFAGAWIEIFSRILRDPKTGVAPFAGAWIEISVPRSWSAMSRCRSLRGGVD